MSIRSKFDRELEQLHIELIRMGGMVEEAIAKSVKALETGHNEMAEEVMKDDKNIDALEKVIETRCLKLLMLQQPVARDLRAISTALKMITDMERIGDQAADIADLSLRFKGQPFASTFVKIPQMASAAVSMVQGSIESFVKSDLKLAKQVMKSDDVVDALFEEVKNALIEEVTKNRDSSDEAIDCLMIAKYLERIGDHAVNICEWVEFSLTGVHKSIQIL